MKRRKFINATGLGTLGATSILGNTYPEVADKGDSKASVSDTTYFKDEVAYMDKVVGEIIDKTHEFCYSFHLRCRTDRQRADLAGCPQQSSGIIKI